jgi:hypothetical protein
MTPLIYSFWKRSVAVAVVCAALAGQTVAGQNTIANFIDFNCSDCHDAKIKKGGLDLTALKADLSDPLARKTWVRVFDRVAHGEMPPKDKDQPDAREKAEFLTATDAWIVRAEAKRHQFTGRVKARRLTNLQLERSLHNLLGVDVPLANKFPDEQLTHQYSTVANGQPMSRFQLERHMGVVDLALDEAFRRAADKPDEFTKTFDYRGLSRRNSKRRCREPEVLNGHGVIWHSGLIYYGRIPATTARQNGWYRFTVKAKALKAPKGRDGLWCSVQTGRAVSSAPLMNWAGSFEARQKLGDYTFEVWLEAGEMFEVRPADNTMKKARFRGGQVGAGEGSPQNVPGVAMKSVNWSHFHKGASNDEIRKIIYGDLKVQKHRDWRQAKLVSVNPRKDLRRLIGRFAERAFRRPIDSKTLAPYLGIAENALASKQPLKEALRVGYRAILCSPRFLYFYEKPGALDDHAIASRLSYFLWNRPPDAKLLRLAETGELCKPTALKAQTRRMLKDPRGADFVKDFAAEWLDLRLIDFTTPDRRLYGVFDNVVKNAMLDETHAYLQAMLDKDLSVTHLVDSDFTYLNERLARYYNISGVTGDQLRRVALKKNAARGGVIGQGAVLKVTANGTITSPVVRGVWLMERILGEHVLPPPPNVPAIEPDIRGAKSIRQMLEKHRSNAACAACHAKIDPPGFALENFDPAGAWRTHYGKKGARVIPGDTLADGRSFKDLNGFRAVVVSRPEKLARNMATHLMTYGTGAPVGFGDRAAIDAIVKSTKPKGYGFGSILEAVVTSPVFLQK